MIHYVALSFVPVEGGLAPGEAIERPRSFSFAYGQKRCASEHSAMPAVRDATDAGTNLQSGDRRLAWFFQRYGSGLPHLAEAAASTIHAW
jgi:hypothetical protein